MIYPQQNITSLIPQRTPFVMIDQLVYSDENETRSTFIVREDNIFVHKGYLREPALVENIAQTAAARAGFISMQQNEPVRTGFIAAIRSLEIFSLPAINDMLETIITVENQVFDITIILGKIWHGKNIIAQCEMKIFIPKAKPS